MTENSGANKGDKRSTLRSPLLIQKVRMDDGARAFFGYAKNISRSGMFIATVNPRDAGEVFQVEIPLKAPIHRTVQCRCEVVWKREFAKTSRYEPGMGLRFLDMPQDVADAIEHWVSSQVEE